MDIQIKRSDNRSKTVTARERNGVLEILAPATMSEAELTPIIERLQKRIAGRKVRANIDDDGLEKRARELNQQYFEGKLSWHSIRWVTNQNTRHGSCTPSQGTIRISHRLATMPRFVLDYVVVHELAHLLEANHGPKFWKLVNRFPRTERARGYLMATGIEQTEE